ncbi:MAG TPA: sulfatase-like hydrolase/transferase [Solirubrobacteraceae bacterium]|jgi:arylsulfatase A-like enzyme|nr:sulfatase-like hydrolase/transferase [Solirubrobacteraceae bacterium]
MPAEPDQPEQPDERAPDRSGGRPIDRRTLLKSGLLAGGALAGGGAALAADLIVKGGAPSGARAAAAHRHKHGPGGGAGADEGQVGSRAGVGSGRRRRPPNILVVMVDQLRTPMWFSAGVGAVAAMPNLERLRREGVSFASHYTAANDCTPARSTLLTGLYTHQTGCMITGGSTLDPGFPTYGTLLRELGYRTDWYGKWHLTKGDNLWDSYEDAGALEPYGFAGGTYPSPDGAPGQGWRVDPHIVSQFESWFAKVGTGGKEKPWCTTVSLVNPHDIAWWYRWSERFAQEADVPSMVAALPPNFETPEQMLARGKPRLQRSLQDTAQQSFGSVPYDGPELHARWLPFMDLYLKLLGEVDAHIGAVLGTLASRPDVAAETVIVFTSDHGEYGASHGMRGKGASAYEEAIRVPLVVCDLRSGAGSLTGSGGQERSGLTSSVDVVGLLLDVATGDPAWRNESHYSHLAARHPIAPMLADPSAPGRDYVLHATDETVTEFAIEPYAADAPLHVVALRTPTAKYATYSDFVPGSLRAIPQGREVELYDYSTSAGRMELENLAGNSPKEAALAAKLGRAVREELREPLPRRLYRAHKRGIADYFKTATKAAVKATERRRERAEREAQGGFQEGPFGEAGVTNGAAPATAVPSANRPTPSVRRRAGRAGSRRRTE